MSPFTCFVGRWRGDFYVRIPSAVLPHAVVTNEKWRAC